MLCALEITIHRHLPSTESPRAAGNLRTVDIPVQMSLKSRTRRETFVTPNSTLLCIRTPITKVTPFYMFSPRRMVQKSSESDRSSRYAKGMVK